MTEKEFEKITKWINKHTYDFIKEAINMANSVKLTVDGNTEIPHNRVCLIISGDSNSLIGLFPDHFGIT